MVCGLTVKLLRYLTILIKLKHHGFSHVKMFQSSPLVYCSPYSLSEVS